MQVADPSMQTIDPYPMPRKLYVPPKIRVSTDQLDQNDITTLKKYLYYSDQIDFRALKESSIR